MAATMQQFLAEVSPVLKDLYTKHRGSRADYKEAVETFALRKMPRATETDRKHFADFALNVYDLMCRIGFAPNTSVEAMRAVLSREIN